MFGAKGDPDSCSVSEDKGDPRDSDMLSACSCVL